jgi:hypothetical protein
VVDYIIVRQKNEAAAQLNKGKENKALILKYKMLEEE